MILASTTDPTAFPDYFSSWVVGTVKPFAPSSDFGNTFNYLKIKTCKGKSKMSGSIIYLELVQFPYIFLI
ncbi:MAG: hypothetical protein D8M57_08120 [Candidatus Scalindua sp. AMX11]|nr:MAG: hypothetical protein DWQ00_11720 [Candidatus Scalindua sp.]TDE65477.1 MAG: hypothetical protein D8M57_08120 [Candidatus Scalindua sp. AMX11]